MAHSYFIINNNSSLNKFLFFTKNFSKIKQRISARSTTIGAINVQLYKRLHSSVKSLAELDEMSQHLHNLYRNTYFGIAITLRLHGSFFIYEEPSVDCYLYVHAPCICYNRFARINYVWFTN